MWTSEQYLKFHADCCKKMQEITKKKNADYAGEGDPFKNFTAAEFFGFATNEQGFATRLSDKFSRISTFVQRGFLMVKDESVDDTLLDMANYCILFAGYLKSKRESVPLSKKAMKSKTHRLTLRQLRKEEARA